MKKSLILLSTLSFLAFACNKESINQNTVPKEKTEVEFITDMTTPLSSNPDFAIDYFLNFYSNTNSDFINLCIEINNLSTINNDQIEDFLNHMNLTNESELNTFIQSLNSSILAFENNNNISLDNEDGRDYLTTYMFNKLQNNNNSVLLSCVTERNLCLATNAATALGMHYGCASGAFFPAVAIACVASVAVLHYTWDQGCWEAYNKCK